MSDYPRMLYRPGTKRKVWGAMVDTLIVRDEGEEAAAIGEGWSRSPDGEPAEKPKTDKPQLDHDKDGEAGGSTTAPGDLKALRAEYKAATGKKAFNGWDEATLMAKIEEAGRGGQG